MKYWPPSQLHDKVAIKLEERHCMRLPDHLYVMTEVRALSYETDLLCRDDAERNVGMVAVAQGLRERCYPDALPEELLEVSVSTALSQLREFVMDNQELRRRLAVQQGERTRPYSLHPYEELVELVDGASADAYFTYARWSGVSQETARRSRGSCQSMFYILQHELRKRGVETQHLWWFEAGNNHHFMRTIMPNGDSIDIDPTWQQNLPEDADYSQYPNVLIAPTERMEEALRLHDVPEEYHPLWLAAKVDSREETGWWGWSSELERLFDEDPWIPPLPEQSQRFYASRQR